MLECPYCRQEILEDQESCPGCQFSLDRLNRISGPLPRLVAGLSDATGTLSRSESSKLLSALHSFKRSLPECRAHILIREFEPTFPLSVHLFRLFNMGGLVEGGKLGPQCRDVLIGLDPVHQRIGVMPGYGLEPYLSKNILENLLAPSHIMLQSGKYGAALLGIIKDLNECLIARRNLLLRCFSLTPEIEKTTYTEY